MDPTTLLLLQVNLGILTGLLGCILLASGVWTLDLVFKTTRAYSEIWEWRAAWKREQIASGGQS